MRFIVGSRQLFLVLVMTLAFLLVACERPLNEEESTPTPAPESEDASEMTPDETSPVLVPTLEIVPPTTDASVPDSGQSEDGDDTVPAVPPEDGEVVDPADTTEPVPATDAGDPVTLPSGEQVHTVQSGENLYRIGLRYGCTVAELSAYNGITNPNYIDVGQEIRIPTTCGG